MPDPAPVTRWVAHRVKTILPKTSPPAIAAKPSRAWSIGSVAVDEGSRAGGVEHRDQSGELVAGAHRRADHRELEEEDPGELGVVELGPRRRARRDDPAARTQRPDRVRPGRPTHGLHDGVDLLGQPGAGLEHLVGADLERLRALVLVAARDQHSQHRPARASTITAVATPPPAPCTSTVSPGFSPPRVNSIRYAVSQAVGRQAASSKESDAGLGTTLCRGTATRSAKVPWWRSESSERWGSKVSSPVQVGSLMTACTTTSLPSSSSPAASQPRIIGSCSAFSPTPRSENRSWWLSDGGLDRRPWSSRRATSGLGTLPDHQAGQRVVGGEGLGVDGEHAEPS